MRFDWYAATIPKASPHDVIMGLKEALGASDVVESRGLHGYRQRFNLVKPDGTCQASILCGGNPDPHAWASGQDTPAFVDAIRATFPEHMVTRMDPAEDYDEEGSYDRLRLVCKGVKARTGIKGREIIPDEPEDGRTYYLGSPKSAAIARLYEKGLQERRRSTGDPSAISANWTRLEAQLRPQKQARAHAATATPEQAWGYSAWMQALAQAAMSLDVARVQGRVWQPTDDARAFAFMVKQYGPMLERLRYDLGDWASVGLTIGEEWEQERRRRAMSQA